MTTSPLAQQCFNNTPGQLFRGGSYKEDLERAAYKFSSTTAQEYFADAPGQLFKGKSYEEDLERARGCFRHLRTMFQELEECRAFELLKVRPPWGAHPGVTLE